MPKTGPVDKNYGERLKAVGVSLSLYLQPLKRIYLYSNLQSEIAPLGNISNVYLFSGVAFFILLIACFNFINLSTAQAVKRSKEVGIRKTFGAARSKIILQFLGESTIFSGISIVMTLIALEITIPWFKNITGLNMAPDYLKLSWLAAGFLSVFVFVSLFAGFYPALFLSSFKPISILKSGIHTNLTKSRLRSLLVIVQFAITIALIAGSMAIYKQIDFMKNKKLGFNKEHVLALQNVQVPPELSLTSIKEQFLGVSGVENVSLSTGVPGGNSSMINFLPEGRNESEAETMLVMDVDENYISTFGLELSAGRGFSRDFVSDESGSAIINEAAANLLGWENPVGKIVKRRVQGPEGPYWISNTVIGILRDFHLYSLHSKIEPLFMGNTGANFNTICVKIASENLSQTVGLLEKSWNEIVPHKPFDYVFIDQSFDSMYESEENTARVAVSFCFLAIFIACLGLFGLSSFTSEQRTKEIGIRKTLGASVSNGEYYRVARGILFS
jgi:putative ABC transport system permease protein